MYVLKEEGLNDLVLDPSGKRVRDHEPLLLLPFAKKCYDALESFAADTLKCDNAKPRRLQILYTPDEDFFSVVIGLGVKKKKKKKKKDLGRSDNSSSKYNILKI